METEVNSRTWSWVSGLFIVGGRRKKGPTEPEHIAGVPPNVKHGFRNWPWRLSDLGWSWEYR